MTYEERLKQEQTALKEQYKNEKHFCEECGSELCDEEMQEMEESGQDLKTCNCTDCYTEWLKQRIEERKHPDER